MDSTATLPTLIRSRLEAGERLAVHHIGARGEGSFFLLPESYEDALMRIHRMGTTAYQVHFPTEYGHLHQLLSQIRSKKMRGPKNLHAVIQTEPPCITEFRSKGVWEFKEGNIPISSWETDILEDFTWAQFHFEPTATNALISAMLYSFDWSDFPTRIRWNRNDDPVFTAIMDGLANAGLIVCESVGGDNGTVTDLNFDLDLTAKFIAIAHALVGSKATQSTAAEILAKGLRNYLNGIRKVDAVAMAHEFAAAWH